jgi:hypothetical protein
VSEWLKEMASKAIVPIYGTVSSNLTPSVLRRAKKTTLYNNINMPIFNFSKKKKEPETLKELLSQFKELKQNFKKISQELKDLKIQNKFSVKKIGVVRFNPFKETGGDQSFSIALLDGHNDGVVITSLYTKEGNRMFAKPIKNGESQYLLSAEEKKAIEQSKPENREYEK